MSSSSSSSSSIPSIQPASATHRSLKRTRVMHWFAIAGGLALLPTASHALSSMTAAATKTLTSQSLHMPRALPTAPQRVLRFVDENDYDDEEEDDDDDEDYTRNFETDVADFQRLQESTGSEILQSTLQQQIDDSTSHPDQFLDKYAKDASTMERVAMSSITEQLPRRAVEALTKETEQSTTTPTTKKQYKSSLDFAGTRVSREQEIHLARIIQQGVVLHNTRSTAESASGKTLSRQEWADLAGLSATELRRRVH
jgi:hypothetical protein